MTPMIQLETEKFNEVLKRWEVGSKRESSVAINARMAFLLMRAFVLIPPQRVDEVRSKIKAYMSREIGERRKDNASGKKVGAKRGRVLRLQHLIAQARQKKAGGKGLYGAEMRKASGAVMRRAVGSVGYLKSGLIEAIKRFNGHFMQFGRGQKVSRKTGKVTQTAMNPNAAYLKLMASYGYVGVLGNVAKHKGVKVQSWPARPSFSAKQLSAAAQLSIGLKDDQVGKVSAMYDAAFERAFRDERAEMEKVIADRVAAAAEEAVDGNK